MDKTFNAFIAERLIDCIDAKSVCTPLLLRLIQDFRNGSLCSRSADFDLLPQSICEEAKQEIPQTPLVRQKNRYYFQKNWILETILVDQTRRLRSLKVPDHFDSTQFFEKLAALEIEKKVLPEQAEAIRESFSSSLTVICGGPGTGKTYTASHLVRLFALSLRPTFNRPYRIYLAAPTGKAALHLRAALVSRGDLPENLFCECSTLHRMLNILPGDGSFTLSSRVDADLIVVDEASMIDAPLLAQLLQGVGDASRLVLMGDPHQLPPIGSGAIFSDMAALFGSFLKRCVRTQEPSLHQAAESILEGNEERFFPSISFLPDADFSDPDRIVSRLYDEMAPFISWEEPDPVAVFERYNCCRILDALRQGPYGTESLNRKLFEMMKMRCHWEQWWAVPILAIANDSKIGIFNGTPGVLIGQKKKEGARCIAYFFHSTLTPNGQKTAALQFNPPPLYEISFCISIHKSQGSEFERVIALFPQGSENFGKEALYTAATRAKKRWDVVAEKDVLRAMLRNIARRDSGYRERLEDNL